MFVLSVSLIHSIYLVRLLLGALLLLLLHHLLLVPHLILSQLGKLAHQLLGEIQGSNDLMNTI